MAAELGRLNGELKLAQSNEAAAQAAAEAAKAEAEAANAAAAEAEEAAAMAEDQLVQFQASSAAAAASQAAGAAKTAGAQAEPVTVAATAASAAGEVDDADDLVTRAIAAGVSQAAQHSQSSEALGVAPQGNDISSVGSCVTGDDELPSLASDPAAAPTSSMAASMVSTVECHSLDSAVAWADALADQILLRAGSSKVLRPPGAHTNPHQHPPQQGDAAALPSAAASAAMAAAAAARYGSADELARTIRANVGAIRSAVSGAIEQAAQEQATLTAQLARRGELLAQREEVYLAHPPRLPHSAYPTLPALGWLLPPHAWSLSLSLTLSAWLWCAGVCHLGTEAAKGNGARGALSPRRRTEACRTCVLRASEPFEPTVCSIDDAD